ncbi:DUF4145 domain-containing protein [Erwinia persicina]|uniref:DUF4145 domain-containing protein n=1 Tax=Erwinia persicina TaxID=55211 RepID=UPI0007873F50|nr:DUF4145 domain-containing protein [Erwinia persicina]
MSDSLFKSFTAKKCPTWRCPVCFNETLSIVPESFFKTYNGASSRSENEDWFGAEYVVMVFSCVLRCQRSDCGETVAVTGTGEIDVYNYYDESGKTQTDYTNTFHALTFYPPIPLFKPPVMCPDTVLNLLGSVSSLLTGHSTSAANAIRSLLEVLLDDLQVPRESIGKGNRGRAMTLHERIENYRDITGIHHEGMMALKVFGNAGSHGEVIEQKHLEDACLVLEQLVIQLYSSRADVTAQISRLNEEFNKKNRQRLPE